LRMGLSITGFVTAPAFAFSGVGFPLVAMPVAARWWAQCLPFTHYMRVQVDQWVMGAPWRLSLLTPMVMLVISAGLLIWMAGGLVRTLRQPESWGQR
jgi:ABC-2 type transport system permease protein